MEGKSDLLELSLFLRGLFWFDFVFHLQLSLSFTILKPGMMSTKGWGKAKRDV